MRGREQEGSLSLLRLTRINSFAHLFELWIPFTRRCDDGGQRVATFARFELNTIAKDHGTRKDGRQETFYVHLIC